MAKKWKKIASLLFVSSSLLVGTATSIIWGTKGQEENKKLSTELTNQIEKSDNLYNGALNFNGKNYENPDSAAIDYLNENPINQKRYIGDIESSYINRDDHLINVNSNNIREYDSSKLSEAYKDATNENGYTDNYQDAFNSEVPVYQKITRFDDYSGDDLNKLPIDSFEAQKNLKKNVSKPHSIPYYLVKDSNGNNHKINPLNKKDIDELKKIAINEVSHGKISQAGFALEDYYTEEDNKIFRKNSLLNNDILKNNIKNVLIEPLTEFTNKIQMKPIISFQTDYPNLNHSFDKNYSFTIAGKPTKNNMKLEGKYFNIFNNKKNKLVVSDEVYATNLLFWAFSNRENLDKVFHVEDYSYQYKHATVWWSAGGHTQFLDNFQNVKIDESDPNSQKYKNVIEDVFSNGEQIKIEKVRGPYFYKKVVSSSINDYSLFKLLQTAYSDDELYGNSWYVTGTNKWAGTSRMREVYFKFDTDLVLNLNNQMIKINDYEGLKTLFLNYMGIKDEVVDENNKFFLNFKKEFLSYILNSYDDSKIKDAFEYNRKMVLKNYSDSVESFFELNINNNIVNKSKISKYSDKSNKNDIFNITYSDKSEKIKDIPKIKNAVESNYINGENKDLIFNANETKKVITFNKKPLFLLPGKVSDDPSNYLSDLNNVINVSNKVENFTKNTKIISDELKSESITINLDENTINFHNWENIMNKQLSISKLEEDINNIDSKLSGNLMSINGRDDNEIPSQKKYKLGIFSAFYYYKKNLEFFANSNSKYNHLLKNITNRIDKKIDENGLYIDLNPNDFFVILYNNSEWSQNDSVDGIFMNQLYPMNYGEYYGRLTDFNDSLTKDVKTFYNNSIDQKQQLNNFTNLLPPKLNYYVDKKGKVISIDPIKDNVNLSSYPTQSMYDSSKLVDYNLSNNLIIKHDTTKVFYNDNGKNILLKNNIEFLYSLSINKKEYVFDQYNYAFKYLKSYIISNSKKI